MGMFIGLSSYPLIPHVQPKWFYPQISCPRVGGVAASGADYEKRDLYLDFHVMRDY